MGINELGRLLAKMQAIAPILVYIEISIRFQTPITLSSVCTDSTKSFGRPLQYALHYEPRARQIFAAQSLHTHRAD